ncbi:conserved membrane protein of unknown function [Nitrospira sp. KM1]|uniref:hypothetical protein n=1 Tax=Nitrospira sp. KM1 TaxID=1936990 RepID=UPI0013A79E1E|nr:hypothetical protein [Nitrospira sp. KM1]BCA53629.1 conserved membrane protein of unknown function [Nitrospira sp. KM1]
MAKLVAMWRGEEIQAQAKQYVRSYILFPSGILGMVCMVAGVAGLGYQLFSSGSYTWTTFVMSSVLLLVGILFGWVQTRYHRYLLDTVPDVFAARIRMAVQRTGKKQKTASQATAIDHAGRNFVPVAYLGGIATLLGASTWALTEGSLSPLPALMMPWAGFYWGKLFFWRGIVQ